MTLLVVNYHYVAAERPSNPRSIYPVSVGDFERQLHELGRNFGFVGREDVLAAAEGVGRLPARACLVTFDDGLRCQFEHAIPVLERLGIPALFFIPGQPFEERRGLYVHKIHELREQLDDADFLERLTQELDLIGVSFDLGSVERASEIYAYDDPESARLKYFLNHALPLEIREGLIDAVFGALFDEHAFADRLYMSTEQVVTLERDYGAIGAHSYSHQPLALLPSEELRTDLEANAAALERIIGMRPRAISYPYGWAEAVTEAVAQAAEESGFGIGFTMERALNRTLDRPHLLARIDANDAPGGSRPLLEPVGDGFRLRPPMAAARTRYFVEP